MKTLAIAIITTMISFLGMAQNNITVTVENVLNEKGKIIFSLHTAETFMKGPGIQNAEYKVDGKTATITFKNVEPGEYAVMVLHDENENNRMDFELSGMPKEAYATSNNPMSFGPPQFSDSKFEFSEKDLELKIRF